MEYAGHMDYLGFMDCFVGCAASQLCMFNNSVIESALQGGFDA